MNCNERLKNKKEKNTCWLMIIYIKILIDTDDKIRNDITFKNFVILITCFIKLDSKFYPELFVGETLLTDCLH